jgi:hypothetical protein
MANVEFRFESSISNAIRYIYWHLPIQAISSPIIPAEIESLLSSVQVLRMLKLELQATVHSNQNTIPEPANCPALPLVVGHRRGILQRRLEAQLQMRGLRPLWRAQSSC